MVDELDVLAQALNRLIEQERFSEAHAILPEYTQKLDQRLREKGARNRSNERSPSFKLH